MQQDDSTNEAVSNDSLEVPTHTGDAPIVEEVVATNGADHSQELTGNGDMILDINDPRLNEQVEDYDPLADANLFIPAPDGSHLAVIGFSDKPGQSYFVGSTLYALLEATIDEPGQPYTNQTVRGFAWSKVDPKTGTSSLYDLCNKLGYPLIDPETGKALRTLRDIKVHVDSVIGGHPPVMVITQWRGQCRSCNDEYQAEHANDGLDEKQLKKDAGKHAQKKYLQGQRHWPQNEDGTYKPVAICRECGAGDSGTDGIRANAEISRFAKVPVRQ